MRMIADRQGIPLRQLIASNPQIWNPNLIYVGQVIYLPSYAARPNYDQQWHSRAPRADHQWGSGSRPPDQRQNSANYYTIQPGDTLKAVARKYDTTVEALLDLNPSLLGKANRIHVGLVILVR
jgi:LysM repeat protein